MNLSNKHPIVNSSQQDSAASPVAPPPPPVCARIWRARSDLIASASYSWGTQALRPEGQAGGGEPGDFLLRQNTLPSSPRVSPQRPGSHGASAGTCPALSQQDAGRRSRDALSLLRQLQ